MGIINPLAPGRNLSPRGRAGGPRVTHLMVWQTLCSLHNRTELASQLECPHWQFIFSQKWCCSWLVAISPLTIDHVNRRATR